jgi:hypothetical protein
VLRNIVTGAAEQARDEAGFFAGLREAGLLVRLRFSEINPGQVTGYSVSLPGDADGDGTSVWYGGGRLSTGLTLPRLRERWNPSGAPRPAGQGVPVHHPGTGRDLPACGPRGRQSGGAHPSLLPTGSGTGSRCCMGGGGHPARRRARS